MTIILNSFIALIALLHVWFMILEMALWTKPLGLRTFHQSPEKAQSSAALAANQGLYNGFLAAGLIWGLLTSAPAEAMHIKLFFLSCIIVAGLYGAYSVSRRIFFIQALPAIAAIILLFWEHAGNLPG